MNLNKTELFKWCLPAGLCFAVVIIILGGTALQFKGSAGATSRHEQASPDLFSNGKDTPNFSFDGGGPKIDARVRLDNGTSSSKSSSRQPVSIGFIGDSITAGFGVLQYQNAVTNEIIDLGRGFSAVNEGVDGATTADWQPGSAELNDALDAFRANKIPVVSIMLGTNDSKDSVATTPARYKANMRNIINAVLSTGVKHVVLEYPPYVVPRGLWSVKSQMLLKEYQGEINSLVNGQTVLQGDRSAWSYFAAHRNELRDGVHPTIAGYADLGRLWANAFPKNL